MSAMTNVSPAAAMFPAGGLTRGPSTWRVAVDQALAVLDDMDIEGRLAQLESQISRAKAKPYLHALPKQKIRQALYAELIEEMGGMPAQVGALYLHFPFCTKHCTHCHYYKTRASSSDEWQTFPALLVEELRLLQRAWGGGLLSAQTIHFGGGTPSLIQAPAWRRMLAELSNLVDVKAAQEIAVEVDPADLTAAHLEFWGDSGVNRISLGVQSFDDDVLKRLHREHTRAAAIGAVELVQRHGPDNLNVDLMYGMPGRTLESWFSDLQCVISLSPASVTCYATRPDPENRLERAEDFPSQLERLTGHQMAISMLFEAGYLQYSPNQFIRSYAGACLAKNNRNRCLDVLGVGPHAHSILQGWFYENWAGVDTYSQRIKDGQLCPLRAGRIDPEEASARYLQFGLKLSGLGKPSLDNGVSRADYLRAFGRELHVDHSETLQSLSELRLLDLSHPEMVQLTHEGVLLVDQVVRRFSQLGEEHPAA